MSWSTPTTINLNGVPTKIVAMTFKDLKRTIHLLDVLQRHYENTFWVSIRVEESKVGWMDKIICLRVNFVLTQTNGWACVDYPIDGLFWNLPIYLLGFFSKYECWVTDLTMSLYHLNFFWGCHLPFCCIMRFHITVNCKNNHMTNFLKRNLFDKHTNNSILLKWDFKNYAIIDKDKTSQYIYVFN